MAIQPFLIANARIGMERDMEPWLLPEQAYPDLQDCYQWRGRIQKRQGFNFLARLNRKIGTTDGGGGFSITLGNIPLRPGSSQFQVGTTFYQDPKPTSGGDPVTLTTNGPGVATLNRATGALTIVGGPAGTDVFYFPGLPVMGLRTLETVLDNQETLIGFDPAFAYVFDNGAQTFAEFSTYKTTGTVFNWTGNDANFFWTTNYQSAFWATNGTKGFQSTPTATIPGAGDGIRWHDQTIGAPANGWVNFLPPITATTFLMGALIIVPYKGRLVTLSTTEGTAFAASNNFQQRARWSQNGSPFAPAGAPIPTGYTGAASNNAWRSDLVGFGGFIDAPTQEQIISAEFLKDTLIVYFERSTWNLRYTGNEFLPFVWEKINTELGAESTFSIVPFDDVTIAVGDVGIHQCDTRQVQRIDQKIPDEVFDFNNSNSGPQRIYGVRDYFNQLVYWTVPYIGDLTQEEGQTVIYPNKLLVFNYIDQSFSFFNDSFTCFGFYQSSVGMTWGGDHNTWGEESMVWGAPQFQANFPQIVAGNQQGFVEIIMQSDFNDESLIISAIMPATPLTTIVSINHNLQVGMFVKILTSSGMTGLSGKIYEVYTVVDANTFTIETPTAPVGAFTGNGLIAPVNNYLIQTKRFNPWIQEGAQVRLHYVDLYFDKTDNGQVSVNVYVNEDSSVAVNAPTGFPISTVSSIISNITVAASCVVTVADGTQFSVGNVVTVDNVNGMTEINGFSAIVQSIATNNITLALDTSTFSAYTSGGILYNLSKNTGNAVNTFPESTYTSSPELAPFVQAKLWKRLYVSNISQLFQLEITLNTNQMLAEPIVSQDITLHGMILYFSKAGRLLDV